MLSPDAVFDDPSASALAGQRHALGMLEVVYASVARELSAYAVLVTGPAGSDKSRLIRELLARLDRRDERPELLYGRAEPRAVDEPFGMMADVLRRAAGIDGREPPAARRAKLAQRLGRSLEASALAWAGETLGGLVDAGEGAEGAVGAAWEAWLSAECATGPVVLVLDGLDWADCATVRVVGGALRRLSELPFLVIAAGGAEVEEQFPALWEGAGMLVVPMGW